MLAQIQSVKRSNPKAKMTFAYYSLEDNSIKYYPFRIGDIVCIKDWGQVYPSYIGAFVFLTGSSKTPYYSSGNGVEQSKKRSEGDKQCFKIMNVAEHENGEYPLFYIQDRAKHGVVINPKGLKLVKQFPLRKNETINIFLKKIKYGL